MVWIKMHVSNSKKKKKLHVSIKMCILIEYYIPVDKSRILEKKNILWQIKQKNKLQGKCEKIVEHMAIKEKKIKQERI